MESIQAPEDYPQETTKACEENKLWQEDSHKPRLLKPLVSNPFRSGMTIIWRFREAHAAPEYTNIGPNQSIIKGALRSLAGSNDHPMEEPIVSALEKTIGGRRLVPIELGRSYVDGRVGPKDHHFQGVHRGQLYLGSGNRRLLLRDTLHSMIYLPRFRLSRRYCDSRLLFPLLPRRLTIHHFGREAF